MCHFLSDVYVFAFKYLCAWLPEWMPTNTNEYEMCVWQTARQRERVCAVRGFSHWCEQRQSVCLFPSPFPSLVGSTLSIHMMNCWSKQKEVAQGMKYLSSGSEMEQMKGLRVCNWERKRQRMPFPLFLCSTLFHWFGLVLFICVLV